MKHFYILTGYDKKSKQLNTQKRYDLKFIIDIINHYTANTIKSEHDLQFNLESAAHYDRGVILDTPKYSWSIYYV